MKKPTQKVRLIVRASKRQESIGMFDEVRVVRVAERPVCPKSKKK